ncbi:MULTISPECIES: YceI family protein [unclassified Sphingopyxis]|jgi:polyisoprenoid-binding protein YceI|uniref:YceI family protein n=1 Tax=unclassified Sphingopyxis TaxID=2614943 RepID=UPI002861CF29|nr:MULTISPECIES: YceI family protein [unclassified Sphingopyxis]MDR6832205.1 polyisoprenoid-binding protein YceI [Sphingopyxis sp. BE122]MDR7227948.1 polyisoprenoid-binding protein YceI [Sphingopyxis sp. BE259]
MRRIAPLAALAIAVVAVPVVIAQNTTGTPGAPDKTRVAAGTYAADAGHTMVVWEVDHFGFSKYTGIFGDVTGTLVIDPANPAASKVDVTIPVAKVTTASSGLTGHLLRAGKDGGKPDFFGAAPADAKFVSTSVVLDDDGDEATVTGNLTLNGVTKPVTLDVDFHGAGTNPYNKKATVGFEAEGKIRRSDFGIAYGIPAVSDEVELEIHAAFEKQ